MTPHSFPVVPIPALGTALRVLPPPAPLRPVLAGPLAYWQILHGDPPPEEQLQRVIALEDEARALRAEAGMGAGGPAAVLAARRARLLDGSHVTTWLMFLVLDGVEYLAWQIGHSALAKQDMPAVIWSGDGEHARRLLDMLEAAGGGVHPACPPATHVYDDI